MKRKKISAKDFIETLTDNELKNVLGGYGGDVNPAEWDECCYCSYHILGVKRSAWVCGNYGDSDCSRGRANLAATGVTNISCSFVF